MQLPSAALVPYQDVKDIWPGTKQTYTESNSTWNLVSVPVPAYAIAQDPATIIRFSAAYQPSSAEVYGVSYQGRAPLLAVGNWWLQLPVTGSAAASRTLFFVDARLYAGGAEALLTVPVTGVTPAAPATVAVATTDTQILAASATRVRYSISNCDKSNYLCLAFGGNAAVGNRGVLVGPLGSFICDPSDGFGSLEVRGIADTAAVTVAVQAWS